MDLQELLALNAAQRPRRKRVLPRQTYPRNLERQYTTAIRKLLSAVRLAYEPVMAVLPSLLVRRDRAHRDTQTTWASELRAIDIVRPGKRTDVDDVKRLLDEAKKRLEGTLQLSAVTDAVKAQERSVGEWSEREFKKQAKAAIGLDVFAIDPRQRERAAAFVAGNVERIKNLSSEVSNRLSATVLQAVQDGKSYDDIAAYLKATYDFSDTRATLIARDQTGKLYGQINADRQKALGLTKFIWRTSNDDRVRDEHAALEGEVFSYDDPPDEGLPGEAIGCRCHAEPYFDDLLDQGDTATG